MAFITAYAKSAHTQADMRALEAVRGSLLLAVLQDVRLAKTDDKRAPSIVHTSITYLQPHELVISSSFVSRSFTY